MSKTPRVAGFSRAAGGLGWVGLLLASTLVAGGCVRSARIEVPPTLPNTTREQFLTLRWALERVGGAVRAVGMAESTAGSQWDATIAFEGLDEQGQVVSQGSSIIRPGFGAGPTAFAVELVQQGREREFRLRVVRAQQYSRPGR
jgi:hypothetical protein